MSSNPFMRKKVPPAPSRQPPKQRSQHTLENVSTQLDGKVHVISRQAKSPPTIVPDELANVSNGCTARNDMGSMKNNEKDNDSAVVLLREVHDEPLLRERTVTMIQPVATKGGLEATGRTLNQSAYFCSGKARRSENVSPAFDGSNLESTAPIMAHVDLEGLD